MTSPFFTLDQLSERYHCHKRTIKNWMDLPDNPFPQPKIKQRGVSCLWAIDAVENWENGSNEQKTVSQ